MCERHRSIQGAREDSSEKSREKLKTKEITEKLIGKCCIRAE